MPDPMIPPPKPDAAAPPPPGGPPGDVSDKKSAADMVAEAKASGALKPLEDVMKEQGWDMDAGTALLLAQKKGAPGTQEKSPEELAQMLRDDPGIYDDLQALQPGGSLAKMYGPDEPETAKEAASEGPKDEMAEYMGKSDTMKGGDAKKGADLLGKMGMKKPGDLDKNAGKKASFLSKFGGE